MKANKGYPLSLIALIIVSLACGKTLATNTPKLTMSTQQTTSKVEIPTNTFVSANPPEPSTTETLMLPTNTSEPTFTPKPTTTPKPTDTPKPIDTPKPTDTPLPPTNTPEPILLTGKGDSVVDVNNTIGAAIVHIKGNAAGNYFSVTNYGEDGNSINLLVNTTDPYDGFLPLDFQSGEHTTRFEIKAAGEWVIEILSPSSARVLEAPGSIEGKGDEVIRVSNSTLSLIKVSGNANSQFFAVSNYGSDYQPINLLVNATNPYEGIRPLDFSAGGHTTWLEIESKDKWSIEILPLSAARALNVPGNIKGKGDDVILLSGSKPDTAKISGNSGSSFFAVSSYRNDGASIDLLVNTTDPYVGIVILSSDTAILEIEAEGDWSIEITAKK